MAEEIPFTLKHYPNPRQEAEAAIRRSEREAMKDAPMGRATERVLLHLVSVESFARSHVLITQYGNPSMVPASEVTYATASYIAPRHLLQALARRGLVVALTASGKPCCAKDEPERIEITPLGIERVAKIVERMEREQVLKKQKRAARKSLKKRKVT